MILGAQKCGTTTLAQILRSHPSIVMSKGKEPHFFSTTSDWKREIEDYHALFDQQENVLYFEASVTYTFYPLLNLGIWDDLYNYNPDMKFIYIVRNPIDRVISSYMHQYVKGFTDLPIEQALIKERYYTELTRYYTQISPFIEKFGRENILIIDFDELAENIQGLMIQVSEFLCIDIELFSDFSSEHRNKSVGRKKIHRKYINPSIPLRVIRKFLPPVWKWITDNSDRAFHKKPDLDIELKKMILNLLKLEIQNMEVIMNKDLSKWLILED